MSARLDKLMRDAGKLGLGVRRREGKYEFTIHHVVFRASSIEEAEGYVNNNTVRERERAQVLEETLKALARGKPPGQEDATWLAWLVQWENPIFRRLFEVLLYYYQNDIPHLLGLLTGTMRDNHDESDYSELTGGAPDGVSDETLKYLNPEPHSFASWRKDDDAA